MTSLHTATATLAVAHGDVEARHHRARIGDLLLILRGDAVFDDHVSTAGAQLRQIHRDHLVDMIRNLPVSVRAMLGTRPTSGLLGVTSGRALGERSRLPLPGTL
jgi:hypothetical protein